MLTVRNLMPKMWTHGLCGLLASSAPFLWIEPLFNFCCPLTFHQTIPDLLEDTDGTNPAWPDIYYTTTSCRVLVYAVMLDSIINDMDMPLCSLDPSQKPPVEVAALSVGVAGGLLCGGSKTQ